LLSCNGLFDGYTGQGLFMQTGGTVDVAGALALGYSGAHASGTYNLGGGLFVVGGLLENTASQFNFSGGTLQAGAGFSTTAAINLTGLGTITTAANALTISGPLSGSGGLELSGGLLTLGGSNTYNGGTYVTEGTLIAANSEALADGSSLYVGSAFANGSPFGTVAPATAPVAVAAVPEPGTLALLAAALAGAAACRRKVGQNKRSEVPAPDRQAAGAAVGSCLRVLFLLRRMKA